MVQISADIRDLRYRFPENASTLQHFQSYAESVNGQSSITYVNDEFPNDSLYTELDADSSTMHSNGYDPLINLSSLQLQLYESTTNPNLKDDLRLQSEWVISGTYKLVRTLPGHSSGVSSVAFSRNGTQLLSGSWHGSLRLWDVETGRTLQSIPGHSEEATQIVFVGDETIFASASSDTTIKFWDAKSGSLIQRLDDHNDRISGLAYAKYSRELASASEDGVIRIWDIESASARVLSEHRDCVWSLAITDDGRQLVSGSGDGTIRIWDTRARSTVRILQGHTDGVRSISISGDSIASGSWDRTVRLWDIKTGSPIQILQTHDEHISSVVHLGQKWLASGSGDQSTFKLWDIDKGSVALTLKTDGGTISSLAFSQRNGGQLASGAGDRTIRVWDDLFL